MSNRRRSRSRRHRIDRTVLTMTRDLRGCTCPASVEQRHIAGTVLAIVHHDRRCPARKAPPRAAWVDEVTP